MSKVRSAPAATINDLGELIGDFKARLGPDGPLEAGYLTWIAESDTFRTAVMRAVRSTLPNGKRHNHQSRVPMRTLEAYGEALRRAARAKRYAFDRFHTWFATCEAVGNEMKGIGPVTIYDVATRVGRWLELEPEMLYLHAGVKAGADALGIDTWGQETLSKHDLKRYPELLLHLSFDELEDFFCVYREHLERMRR